MTKVSPATERTLYSLAHPHDRPARELTDLLGGKGAALALFDEWERLP